MLHPAADNLMASLPDSPRAGTHPVCPTCGEVNGHAPNCPEIQRPGSLPPLEEQLEMALDDLTAARQAEPQEQQQ